MLIDYTKDLQSKALENYNILSTSQGALQVLKNKSMKCPNFEWKEDHTPGRGLPGRDRSSIQARDRDGWQRIRGRRRSRTETEASTPMGGQQFLCIPVVSESLRFPSVQATSGAPSLSLFPAVETGEQGVDPGPGLGGL
jgi:hypothetical protein